MNNQEPGTGPQRNESDVYDRQIRLWGAEAQGRLSSARVLYVHISGVSSEILKNLVLAGVKAAICDGRSYPSAVSTVPSSFLPPGERIARSDEGGGEEANGELSTQQPTAFVEKTAENGASPEQDGSSGGGSGDKDVDGPRKKARLAATTVASAMRPYVHELNPLLDECEIDERSLENVPDEYFANFDIVVASRVGIGQATRIASATTSAGGKFYLVDAFGLNGCALIDLGKDHVFRKETGKDKLSDATTLPICVSFDDAIRMKLGDAVGRWDKVPPKIWATYRSFLAYEAETGHFPCLENADDFVARTKKWLAEASGADDDKKIGTDFLGFDEDLKALASLADAELSPVCAVLGGLLGNEIIKAISGKGEPAYNLLMFDGVCCSCTNFLLQPQK